MNDLNRTNTHASAADHRGTVRYQFITFGLTYMSPGDPVRNMYSANGVMPTEEMVEQTREEMGLNDPFLYSMEDGLATVCREISGNPIP